MWDISHRWAVLMESALEVWMWVPRELWEPDAGIQSKILQCLAQGGCSWSESWPGYQKTYRTKRHQSLNPVRVKRPHWPTWASSWKTWKKHALKNHTLKNRLHPRTKKDLNRFTLTRSTTKTENQNHFLVIKLSVRANFKTKDNIMLTLFDESAALFSLQ